ncbi:hypothetical protein [Puia dinghuensis]|uniref:Crp/Fnr family transcriptional regulator n=1 Tax=Puia dinghuensis TaxID=1792502 RepID=A0A8J2UD70_9BACT|nr:hypothetical protein [Puia dinghuensis]GGB01527.1 hypothetical protein GCM10011511_26070 [Puia dinghuensis]
MRTYWIEQLPGMPELPYCCAGPVRPERVTSTFIEEGYFVEYFDYPYDRQRTVAMLFGPREFVVRCHPVFSTIQALDRSSVVEFSYGNVFRTLRQFPEAAVHYKIVKELYEKKVADRLVLARIESDEDRFRFVREKQGWVLSRVPDGLIAGYLGVSRERLAELKRGV